MQVAGVVRAPFSLDDLVLMVGDALAPGFKLKDIPPDDVSC
jgi:hypothetical protein